LSPRRSHGPGTRPERARGARRPRRLTDHAGTVPAESPDLIHRRRLRRSLDRPRHDRGCPPLGTRQRPPYGPERGEPVQVGPTHVRQRPGQRVL